jgi:hypothetical protein
MDKTTAQELSERIRREMPEVQVTIHEKRNQGKLVYGIEALHTKKHRRHYFSRPSSWKSIRGVWSQLSVEK